MGNSPFIKVIDRATNRPTWVRYDSIVRFSVFNGITTIVVAGTNDQDNHIWAEGDLTDLLTNGEGK